MHKDCIIVSSHFLHSNQTDFITIHGKPLLQYACEHLQKFHFCKLIFSIPFKNKSVQNFISENRNNFKFAFDFVEEKNEMSSGEIIMNALPYSDTEDIFIINSGLFLNINFDEMLAQQELNMADCTVALTKENIQTKYYVSVDSNNLITLVSTDNANKNNYKNAGIYCVYKNSFLNIPFQAQFSFEEDYLAAQFIHRDFFGFYINNILNEDSMTENKY